ncbi:hypothetical protein BCD64_13590 [Nostoc sp. MBR 210]|nr:hypothetical protein BCD64_13590 [Nostoc sp. MBR 210]
MGGSFLEILKESFRKIKLQSLETTKTALICAGWLELTINKLFVTSNRLYLIDIILARHRPSIFT